ncbi:MAG: transcriptional regulator [Candidatus Thermoplasmatota archaeon]|nr:transcriptional regulator [Candidatus Thermoplasmatota archaeon]
MQREEIINQVRETLANAGFYLSELYSMRQVGFDLVARRDNSLLIIKVLTNIDAMTEDLANELRTLAILLKACPLLIGEKTGFRNLEHDVLYDRFGIQAITNDTLKNHLLEGMPLDVYAAPGELYVNLDKEKIKTLRREQNLSIGSFAREIKVSRRTIQMYEEGMNATIEVALRIEDVLGENITVPIDILQHNIKNDDFKQVTKRQEVIGEFQREIFTILEKIGYRVIPIEKAPFEAISQDKKKILLTCVDRYDEKLLKKARIVSSISNITEKHAVIISDKDVSKKNISGTPLIVKKELKKARGPEEILELILERLYNKSI